MAITSTYYDTSAGVPASLVTETDWAQSHPSVGSSEYGVVTAADFKVTAHPSTPYGLNVATGQAWGHGVFDVSDSTVTVTATAPGATRWDLVAVRRDWTPASGGPSTVVVVEGGSVEAIPAARENDPGTLDDQPLYLVQWAPGEDQPTQLIDIRCWAGNGGMFAKSTHVLSYLNRVGASVQLARGLWEHSPTTICTYELGANDVPGWVIRDNTQNAADISEFGSGWLPASQGLTGIVTAGSPLHRPRVRRDGNMVHMFGAVRRNGGPRTNLCTIPVAFRPFDASVQFIGTTITSQGIVTELLLENGIISCADNYATGIANQDLSVFPLVASWAII